MQNIKNIDNGYEFIDSLETQNKELIEFLKRFNEIYNNIEKYNTGFDYNVIVENVPENYKDELFDGIYNLLNIYGLNLQLESMKRKERMCIHITEDTLISTPHYYHRYENHNNITVYTLSTKISDYNLLLGENYDKNKYLILSYGELDKETAINNLLYKLKDNSINNGLKLSEYDKIYDYLIFNELCGTFGFCDYLYSLIIKWMLENNKNVIDREFLSLFIQEESDDPIMIDDLIGLDNVKNEINRLKNYVDYCKNNKIDISKTYLNMFFLGNPGTGKTTVAKLIGQELYNLGLLKENKVVCVVPNDLIGRYVGHTKDTIRNVLNNAKGGILFIDEAYNMLSARTEKGGMFMQEAVEELLKYLENPENIVIFGGYKNEMLDLYNINPGLKSRIYKEIYFDDFSTEELITIIKMNLSKYNLKLGNNSAAMTKILDVIENVKNDNEFGNARFCEKMAQDIFINHINNNLNNKLVSINDISTYKYKTERMGF